MHGLQHYSVHSSMGFTPFYVMFGRKARLLLDLKFGSGDSTMLSSHDYVWRLQRALEYAYDTVHETLESDRKLFTTRKFMETHTKLGTKYGYTPVWCPKEATKNFITHGLDCLLL